MAIRRPNGEWIAAKLPNGDWLSDHIRAAVRQVLGISLAELARQHGLSESACRNAIIQPNAEGEAAIAEALAVPPGQIWPSRYRRDGRRRLKRRPRKHRSPASHPRHRQKTKEGRT